MKMNGIEVTFGHNSLSLKTEVMTLRDALDACRNSSEDLEPTDESSCEKSSATQVHNNEGNKHAFVQEVLYQDGATPLFKAIEEVKWRDALRITKESPYQVFTWVRSTGTQNTTFDWSLWRRLPLHEVCSLLLFFFEMVNFSRHDSQYLLLFRSYCWSASYRPVVVKLQLGWYRLFFLSILMQPSAQPNSVKSLCIWPLARVQLLR